MRRQWVFDPHSGGVKIPPAVRTRTVERIEKYAAKQYAGKYIRLDIRFRGSLCYIDAYVEPAEPSARMLKVTGETRQQFLDRLRAAPLHLCRLRHFAEDRWTMAFFTHSNWIDFNCRNTVSATNCVAVLQAADLTRMALT
jgi:hypothetical protein